MRQTFITDLRDFLNKDDSLPNLGGPALRMAFFHGAIVGWVSRNPGPFPSPTNVPCRRHTAKRPCTGEIVAGLSDDGDVVLWLCTECGEEGQISNWRGTRWDKSR
jgi:hypothetical protein